jgi:hypothetical protein
MATPLLLSVQPAAGPTSGGDLVRLSGSDFARQVAVRFGGASATVLAVVEDAGVSVALVHTPAHEPGSVDIELENLDDGSEPIPGERATLPQGYRFLRPRVAEEADLTRMVRTLLRELKRQVIANVSASVSVDYDDTVADGLRIVALAKLPSIVLSGPTLRPNRFYSENEPHEDVVSTEAGLELVRRRPPYTVDLLFTITAASERTVELFNLMAAVATFLNRNRWIQMLRDPANPAFGSVRWEMDADGEFRTELEGKDDVRAFSCGLLIRGVDVDEGQPLDVGKLVEQPELESAAIPGSAS